MVAPLIGAAAIAAAKLLAKKLAKEAAKKAAKTATTRARSNSAAAAKVVAPAKRKGPVKVLVPAKKTPTGAIKINTNPSKSVVKPVMVAPKKLSPVAEQSLADMRKALGVSKPDPKELARRLAQDKAREAARIRKQGRNTR